MCSISHLITEHLARNELSAISALTMNHRLQVASVKEIRGREGVRNKIQETCARKMRREANLIILYIEFYFFNFKNAKLFLIVLFTYFILSNFYAIFNRILL